MNSLTEFEKPLYRKIPEHPGLWKPHIYKAIPIKTAMDSTDPHLLSGYEFNNLYLQSPTELPAWKHTEAESYEQFTARLKGQHKAVYQQYFEGKDLKIDILQQNRLDQQNSTYRRHFCGSNRTLDSLDIKRKKIRAQKLEIPIPAGWEFKPTTSASAYRNWSEVSALSLPATATSKS